MVAGAALLLVAIPPLLLAIECVRFSALPLFVFRAQSQLHGANAAFFRKLFEWLEREGDDDADADADIGADSDDRTKSGMSSSSVGAAAADPAGSGCLDRLQRLVCGSCCCRRDSDLNSDRGGKSSDGAAGKVAPVTPREFLAVAPAASASATSSAPAAASATASTIALPPAAESLSTAPTKGAGLASKLRALSRFCAVSFIERLIQNYAPHLTAQAYWYSAAELFVSPAFLDSEHSSFGESSCASCIHVFGIDLVSLH